MTFKKGHIPWIKDKHHTEGAKQKMIKSHKNISEETRQKISDANKGKIAWNKGKKTSEETKRKMKEAWIRRRERDKAKTKEI